MEKTRGTKYVPEQLANTEQMAKLLKSVPKEKENILVTMANVFISGMEAGAQLSQQKAI